MSCCRPSPAIRIGTKVLQAGASSCPNVIHKIYLLNKKRGWKLQFYFNWLLSPSSSSPLSSSTRKVVFNELLWLLFLLLGVLYFLVLMYALFRFLVFRIFYYFVALFLIFEFYSMADALLLLLFLASFSSAIARSAIAQLLSFLVQIWLLSYDVDADSRN